MASTGVWFHTRYMRTGSPETPSSETLIDLQIGRTRNSSIASVGRLFANVFHYINSLRHFEPSGNTRPEEAQPFARPFAPCRRVVDETHLIPQPGDAGRRQDRGHDEVERCQVAGAKAAPILSRTDQQGMAGRRLRQGAQVAGD